MSTLPHRGPLPQRGPLAEDDERHGTINGYLTYRCSCGACKAAWAKYQREYQRRKKEQAK